MKEAIRFVLKGSQGIIKKPESNTTYFTYNNPHKIMIYGLLGSIIGENGYNYNLLVGKENELPEYYTNLKHLKIGIMPNSLFGNFNKKIQVFNNSVGYASKEEGGNLIVREQWLEEPSWQIYILGDDSDTYKKIKEYLLNSKCEYIPYIGKNDHFATICDVNVCNINEASDVQNIDSLYINSENIKVKEEDIFEKYIYNDNEKAINFTYREVMPTGLNAKVGYIDFREFLFSNQKLDINKVENIYKVEGKNIFFF